MAMPHARNISLRIKDNSKYIVTDKLTHPNNQFVTIEYQWDSVIEYVDLLNGLTHLQEIIDHILIKRYDTMILMTDSDEGWMIVRGPFNSVVMLDPFDNVWLLANAHDAIEHIADYVCSFDFVFNAH